MRKRTSLKNKDSLVRSCHLSLHNFITNLCASLTAYSIFDNKPEVPSVHLEKTRHLSLLLIISLIPNSRRDDGECQFR